MTIRQRIMKEKDKKIAQGEEKDTKKFIFFNFSLPLVIFLFILAWQMALPYFFCLKSNKKLFFLDNISG